MTCGEIQEQLAAFLMNELDDPQRRLIEEHLSTGCLSCKHQLDELDEAIGLVYEVVPSACLTSAATDQILQAAAGKHLPARTAQRRGWQIKLVTSLATIAAGFLAAAGLFYLYEFTNPNASNEVASDLPDSQSAIYDTAKDSATQLVENQFTPDSAPAAKGEAFSNGFPIEIEGSATMVSLRVTNQEFPGELLIAVDELARQLHVYGKEFEPAPHGSDYVFFASCTDGLAVPLANPNVDETGSFRVIAEYPAGKTIAGGFVSLVANEDAITSGSIRTSDSQ